MAVETLISEFGYPALALGMLLEGETVLVLAAFLAHRGYLDLRLVILIGLLVTFAADQFFFWLGRTRGARLLDKRPAWQPNVERARQLLHRNSTLVFIGFRFMYGLRIVMPIVFGMTRLDPVRFAVLNFLGAAIWATTFGLIGYWFGHLLESAIQDIAHYELAIVVVIALLGAGILMYRRSRAKRLRD